MSRDIRHSGKPQFAADKTVRSRLYQRLNISLVPVTSIARHRGSGMRRQWGRDLQILIFYNARFPGKYENALEGTMRFHGH